MVAIRKVIQGASYLSPLIARETVTFLLNQRNSAAKENRITKRQSEILQLLSGGHVDEAGGQRARRQAGYRCLP